MVGEDCCPQCPAVKRVWPSSPTDKWCLLRAPWMSNDAFLLAPSMQGDTRTEPAWWGWWNPSYSCFISGWRCSRMGSSTFSLPSMSVGSGWHILGGWQHSPVVLTSCHVVLQVLRDTHLPLHSSWLYLRGLFKNLVKPGVKTQLQRGSWSPHPQQKRC